MTKIRIAKIAGIAAGATLLFGSFVPMAGAQTVAELQAQINALMAQLAALQGGSVSTGGSAAGCTFTRSLTVGSSGADVTCLQNYLRGTGHFTFAGGATGYFGPITRTAVAAWQAANGVSPAVGYFGPISQARYMAVAGGSVSGPGTTPGTTTGISTPGVEGTITASKAPIPASGVKVYEGGSRVSVLGIELEADLSDIKVERVKLKLDADTSGNSDQQFYTKIADRIYVMDGSTVLASTDLNANTVVKEGSDYYITIAGFGFIVPKDTEKVLTIAIDPKASWDSTYDNDNWSLTVAASGVRGIDGAGINQYSPSSTFSNSFVSAADIVDSAALTVSLSNTSPATSQVIANQGSSNNEYDELTLAKFDYKAEDDDVTITDLVVNIVRGGTLTTATATTGYIYDGSTLIGSATVNGTTDAVMSATFSDIDWTIPADTTRSLTFKVDIDSAGLLATTFSASSTASGITSENSAGSSISESGSAQGKTITVRKVGPEVTLVSKSITTSGVPQTSGSNNPSTSTLTATFNIKVKAVGGTVTLGTVASGTPVIASSTTSFKVYRNGAYDSAVSSGATSTSYTIPSTCTSVGTNSCNLSDGNEVTIPVTFLIHGRTVGGSPLSSGLYAVGFEGIQWFNDTTGSVQTTNFMAGEVDWRTADVSFP
jgi:peptidoglycan hydrolase-like protein with peptidoglycan-binding domain